MCMYFFVSEKESHSLDSLLKYYINMWCVRPSHHPRTNSGLGTQRQTKRHRWGSVTVGSHPVVTPQPIFFWALIWKFLNAQDRGRRFWEHSQTLAKKVFWKTNPLSFSGLFALVILTLHLGWIKKNAPLWIPPHTKPKELDLLVGGNMGVEPKIGVLYPPKWMVKIMENPIKIHDLGVPQFLETPIWLQVYPGIHDANMISGVASLTFCSVKNSFWLVCSGQTVGWAKQNTCNGYTDYLDYLYIYIYIYICDSERCIFVVSQRIGRVPTMIYERVMQMSTNVQECPGPHVYTTCIKYC